MILMRLCDKNHQKQDRNDNKASSLVNSETNEAWFPTEFCLLVDSAVYNKVELLNYAFSTVEALAIAHPPDFYRG